MAKGAKATKRSPLRIIGKRLPQTVVEAEQMLEGLSEDEIERWLETGDSTEPEPQSEGVGDALARLSPGEFAAYAAMLDHVTEDLARRVVAGHRLCMIARLRAPHWKHVMAVGVRAALLDRAQACGLVPRISGDVIVTGVDRGYGRTGIDVEYVAERLEVNHVIVAVLDGDKVDDVLPTLADLDVKFRVGPDALVAAIRRRFPDAQWWPGVRYDRVQPSFLDVALKRAATAREVIDMLTNLGRVETEHDREMARKKEKQVKLYQGSVSTSDADKVAAKSKAIQDAAKLVEVLRPKSPMVADLHGYGPAQAWAADLVRDVDAFRAGCLRWSDVDAGCLLYGPPGTGKTTFASALAASTGLPFLASSFAQWQGQRGGHLGDIVTAMQGLFEAGNQHAPCIVFIDEIDAIPPRGRSREHDDYWRPIVNAALECLDGTKRREGVIVIAACNDPSGLDPALVRSGRLDRKFEIGLPDEAALAGIFAHHLPDIDPIEIEPVAVALAGSISGADVSRFAREARRLARRKDREVTSADILAVALPPETREPASLRKTAIHEAGHAVAFLLYGIMPKSLSLIADGDSMGRVHVGGQIVTSLHAGVVPILAGRAAEEAILGRISHGAGQDLEQATSIVAQFLEAGVGGRLAVGQTTASDCEVVIRRLYAEAMMLVLRHRIAVETLAAMALERRVLSQRMLQDFAIEFGLASGGGMAR